MVAVSCNVATFARDAKILIDGGYRIERRHAGRPVPPHAACGVDGGVPALSLSFRGASALANPESRSRTESDKLGSPGFAPVGAPRNDDPTY